MQSLNMPMQEVLEWTQPRFGQLFEERIAISNSPLSRRGARLPPITLLIVDHKSFHSA